MGERLPAVGFVGVGAMGSPMARRLAERGLPLVVHDRDPDAGGRVPGATVAGAAGDLADRDIVVTMLPDGAAVRDCLLGDWGGAVLAEVLRPGTVVLDMSSSAPAGTVQLAACLTDRGLRLVDAPVSGGVPRAEQGTLAIMAGGDAADLDRCRPVLDALGSRVFHVGGVGAGHAMKALNNMLSAAGLAVAVEVLATGQRFGLEPRAMLEVLNASTGRNNSTENKIAQQVFSRDFAAGFSMRLMVKDLLTAIDTAHQTGTSVPVSAACLELWKAALHDLEAEGGERAVDHTAIARYVEDRAGVVLE
ncbi:MAG: NAD(P)-dependent oxidoreductase [Streptosporangiaceae bacterium]